MQNASRMRVFNGGANDDESIQQPAQLEIKGSLVGRSALMQIDDRLAQTFSLNHPHGVIRSAIGVAAQPVDRNNSGVFQVRGDFSLAQESIAAVVIVDETALNLLERDKAVELCVAREVNTADASLRMQIQ
jgi:hypothetical protein